MTEAITTALKTGFQSVVDSATSGAEMVVPLAMAIVALKMGISITIGFFTGIAH